MTCRFLQICAAGLPTRWTAVDRSVNTMNNQNTTESNVGAYTGYSCHSGLSGAERNLLGELLRPGWRALDIGCGTGRIARAMYHMGAVVDACDLNIDAIDAFRREIKEDEITVHVADARSLPFQAGVFDLVIFGFNGLDFLHPESERTTSVVEMARVLKDSGVCIFSSHNPLGEVMSPRGMRSLRSWKNKFHQIVSGGIVRQYHRNHQGLILYHALPGRIIRHIEEVAPLRFERMIDKAGKCSNRLLLTLFSPWPYYVFRKLQSPESCKS